jgi:ribosomal protein S12 methylthiotransferase accessory factor
MISTGTAAHPDIATALVSAICEVIERDAISITWLARLPLPMIEIDRPVPPRLNQSYSLLNGSLVKQYFFDATSDLGVPTVYALQLLDGHANLSQFVSCATGFDIPALCAKAIREASPARAIFQHHREIPSAVSDFATLYDGSTYLGRPEHRRQFAFLIDTPKRRSLSECSVSMPSSSASQLGFLVNRLRELGSDVIAVDITPDEVRNLGLWVVRVVIPGLMPMSIIHRGRFLGHPRLYSYPEKAGFGKLHEDDINPAPQPFA